MQVISSSGVDTDTLWFSIGSVETFERNLETVQHELGIDPARSVPVVYKSQTELGTVLSFLPTVLLIGFLIWSMRRAGSMMGGMGGAGRGGAGGGGLFGNMMQVCQRFDYNEEINFFLLRVKPIYCRYWYPVESSIADPHVII